MARRPIPSRIAEFLLTLVLDMEGWCPLCGVHGKKGMGEATCATTLGRIGYLGDRSRFHGPAWFRISSGVKNKVVTLEIACLPRGACPGGGSGQFVVCVTDEVPKMQLGRALDGGPFNGDPLRNI